MLLGDEARTALLAGLYNDGYYQHGPVIPAAVTGVLAQAVAELYRAGEPLERVFERDEPWLVAGWLRPALEAVLGPGFRQLPALTAWYVDHQRGDAGWAPHRDRPGTLVEGRRPTALTVWLPLTDATPDNGCIHVLPADVDPWYGGGDLSELIPVQALQGVRALPARAGSFLCWTHELLHWGGRASRTAVGPRIALGLELQRGDVAPFATPLLDPTTLPPRELRLQVIGASVLRYRTMRPTPEAHLAWARQVTGTE